MRFLFILLAGCVCAGPLTTGPVTYQGALAPGTNLGDNGPYAAPKTAATAQLFYESQYTGAPLVNCAGAGTCTWLSVGLTALPFSTYDVYLLHYDLTPNPGLLSPVSLAQSASFGVLFEKPIAGIIANTAMLSLADLFVGVSGVTYPTSLLVARGLDIGDSVTVDGLNPAQLRAINLGVSSGIDEIRIFVETPEPATWALLLAGGAVFAARRLGKYTHIG